MDYKVIKLVSNLKWSSTKILEKDGTVRSSKQGRSLVILTLSFRDFTVQRSALKNDYVCNSKGIEAMNFEREQDRGIWGLCREEKKRKCYIIISNI